MMTKLVVTTHVDATREEVFAVISDFENCAEHLTAVDCLEVLTDAPIGKGTRFRETRTMFGRQTTEEMEITDYDPPEGYVVECDSCGSRFRSELKLISDISGTHLRMTIETQPVTLMARLMSPLGSLMIGSMRKCIETDLADIKRVAEANAAPVVALETSNG